MGRKKKYSTVRPNCACILLAKGFTLLDIDKNDPYQPRFIFERTLYLERLVRDFDYASIGDPLTLVDARLLIKAIGDMKNNVVGKGYSLKQMEDYE